MNIKKLATATIIAGVLFFLLGWLVYGNLLDHYMRHHLGRVGNVYRPSPVMLYIAIGSLLQGATFAYIFVRANVKSLSDGLITGIIIGFLMAAFTDSFIYGSTYITCKKAILADVIAATIIAALIGAVLGTVLGSDKKVEG